MFESLSDGATEAEAKRPIDPLTIREELAALHRDLGNRVEELNRLFDVVPVGIAVAQDRDCQIIFANEVCERILRMPSGSNISSSRPDSRVPFKVYRGDHQLISGELPMQRAAREGMIVTERELLLKFDDGTENWISVYAAPLFDDMLHSRGCVAAFIDITEEKRVEKNLQAANDRLEERVADRTRQIEQQVDQLRRLAVMLTEAEQRERTRISRIVHDELQQLLTAARMRLQRGINKSDSEELKEQLYSVQALLDSANDIGRSLTSQLSPPIRQHAGFADSLRWLADWMEQTHELKVHFEIDDETDRLSGTHANFAFEAVRELLFNARKHSNVSEARLVADADDDFVRLRVEDSGRGMALAEDVLSGLPRHEGFGLWSIYERLEWLGGRMKVDSREGEGFVVELLVPAAGADLSDSAPAVDTPALSTPTPGRTMRVMLVDDHDIVRQGLVMLLEDESDIEVVAQAADGLEAINVARQVQPDVIVMDVNLPGMNGVTATKSIRQILPNVTIVALSMNDDASTQAAMMEAGAQAYLTKTAVSGDLVTVLRERWQQLSNAKNESGG